MKNLQSVRFALYSPLPNYLLILSIQFSYYTQRDVMSQHLSLMKGPIKSNFSLLPVFFYAYQLHKYHLGIEKCGLVLEAANQCSESKYMYHHQFSSFWGFVTDRSFRNITKSFKRLRQLKVAFSSLQLNLTIISQTYETRKD